MLSPASPVSKSFLNISTPVQTDFFVSLIPTISISSPVFITPDSTLPVTTVPLPEIENTFETTEDIPEIAEKVDIENVIPAEKFTRYKKRLTSEEDYHQRVEQRINDLITKLENKEIILNDLTEEDQKVILDILNQ